MQKLKKSSKLCNSCFCRRAKIAKNATKVKIMDNNTWSLYMVPARFIGLVAPKFSDKAPYNDGYIYHLYFDGLNEQWKKNFTVGKCDICSNKAKFLFYLNKY